MKLCLLNASVAVAALCLISLSASNANEVEDLEESTGLCVWTGPTCIDSCWRRPDGFYQWCRSRNIYIQCTDGSADLKPCPTGQIWDDNRKQCNETSTAINYCYQERETCISTGSRCVTDCSGHKDGDYQSCRGCAIYASCVGGKIIDYRPCAPTHPGTPPLQWDDITKRCDYTSRTCIHCYRENQMKPDRLSWSSILKK